MRTIKFRSKNVFNGEWVYGYLEKHENALEQFYYAIGDGFNNITPVEENTIGQFTGLHDKNGKEIYEGDIVLSDFFTWEGKCIVKFGEYYNEEQWESSRAGYGWYTEMLNGEPSSRRELNNDVLEVIGNIHEEELK